LAHPADYFFPLAEATLAERERRNPFPWLNRALERGPTVARTHLFLAEVLRVRGADSQALLALSLAAQYEPPLASVVPRVALAITRDPNELVRAAPSGPVGAKVLAELGTAMTDPADAAARARVDALALARNERLVPPRLRLLERTLDDLNRPGGCPDRAACEREVQTHADALAAFAPRSTHAARARGRLALLRGDVAGAVALLESGCQSPDDRGPCLELLIDAHDRAGRAEEADRRLEEYVSVACARRTTCADGHAWAARWLLARGKNQRAVTELERAARADPIEARWLAVADAAERAGLRAAALDALDQVVALGGPAAGDAGARLAKLRAPR
jgi:tetratricopeptide (TPR) repeat protein